MACLLLFQRFASEPLLLSSEEQVGEDDDDEWYSEQPRDKSW